MDSEPISPLKVPAPKRKSTSLSLLVLVGGVAFLLGVGLMQDARSATGAQSDQFAATSKSVADLTKMVTDLQNRLAYFDAQKVGVLRFDQKGYDTVETNLGTTLLISILKVEPYLDGLKVYFNVGNQSAVRYDGVKLDLSWDQGTKSEDAPQTLWAGSWTPIDVLISPAAPDKTKSVNVTATLKTVEMTQR